jgi:amidase
MMKRLPVVLLLALLSGAARSEFNVVEASIMDMQRAMASGDITSRGLVQQYLTRIALYDKKLNAVMTVNPNALREAEEHDRERARGRLRGPLHGIPIALKDNIHTTDMPTTGGALAFEGFVPPYEATVVKNLRDAGAVIIAKTGMTELANWMAGPPTPMPSGYNPVSGFGMNPYDPRRDPREGSFDGRPVLLPGGSSSGIGTAANLWAANVGTETSGSLLNPANLTMLVAIKPTVGRISRHGIIPLTADQDTAGPMARTVADAALLLGVLEDAQPDPQDPVKACPPPPDRYGQSQLDISDEMDIEADRTRYEIDRAKDIALSAVHGIDEIMQAERLDAILFPAGSGAILSARPG